RAGDHRIAADVGVDGVADEVEGDRPAEREVPGQSAGGRQVVDLGVLVGIDLDVVPGDGGAADRRPDLVLDVVDRDGGADGGAAASQGAGAAADRRGVLGQHVDVAGGAHRLAVAVVDVRVDGRAEEVQVHRPAQREVLAAGPTDGNADHHRVGDVQVRVG